MEKISIIIPVYNVDKYINKSIKSLINQTYGNIELIIVNDGSTDQSEYIIQDFLEIDSRIKYYKNTNHGVSYSRNFGISKATGDYIMFVDADDVVDENLCEILISNMITNNADLSVCGYQIIYKQELDKDISRITEVYTDTKFSSIFNVYKGFMCNKLYKKNIIVENNIVLNENVSMSEDLLFNFEYLKYANKVVYCSAKLYGYLMHSNNSSKTISSKWFSILQVYNILFLELSQYDDYTQKNIMLYFLYILFEAKVRCDILNISFEHICQTYNINYKALISKYYKIIMKDKKIYLNQKIKLFFMYKVYWLSKKIKKAKILKG